LSDYVWQRTAERLRGLGDDEYQWEPVARCWTIRRSGEVWAADTATPPPDPPPVTTIAWRLFHLTDCYGDDRNAAWLGVDGGLSCTYSRDGAGPTAAAALELLHEAQARWRRVLTATTDEGLAAPLGSIAGPFGDASRAGFVLHMLDEFIHHGAEIALLRDLWRAR
jgi:uncharacterized damage-inducible protein DinB